MNGGRKGGRTYRFAMAIAIAAACLAVGHAALAKSGGKDREDDGRAAAREHLGGGARKVKSSSSSDAKTSAESSDAAASAPDATTASDSGSMEKGASPASGSQEKDAQEAPSTSGKSDTPDGSSGEAQNDNVASSGSESEKGDATDRGETSVSTATGEGHDGGEDHAGSERLDAGETTSEISDDRGEMLSDRGREAESRTSEEERTVVVDRPSQTPPTSVAETVSATSFSPAAPSEEAASATTANAISTDAKTAATEQPAHDLQVEAIASGEPVSMAHGGDARSFDPDRGRAAAFDRQGYAVEGHDVFALTSTGEDISTLADLGLTVTERTPLDGVGLVLIRIHVPDDQSSEAAVARLAAANADATFALNHLYQTGSMKGPATPASRHSDRPAGSGRVGMLDGAVSPSLLPPGSVQQSRRFNTSASSAQSGHATAVADLLLRSGAGQVVAADVFNGDAASAAAIVKALDWLAAEKVAVINVSLAGPPNPLIEKMVAVLQSRGHLIVAAMGNDGPAAPPLYPAAYPGVVAVTAVDANGRIYRRANRGDWVMVSARGVDIEVMDAEGSDRRVSGTSFAAPVVSARLAHLLPAPDPAARSRALDSLVKSARDLGPPGRDPIYGYGLVEGQP